MFGTQPPLTCKAESQPNRLSFQDQRLLARQSIRAKMQENKRN